MGKFLVKNISARPGIYKSQGVEHILEKGAQVYLDFPPEFASVEIKVMEMKQ